MFTKIDEEQFLKLDLKDLSETLGIKYFSDRRKLIDAQKKLKGKASGAGGGRVINVIFFYCAQYI